MSVVDVWICNNKTFHHGSLRRRPVRKIFFRGEPSTPIDFVPYFGSKSYHHTKAPAWKKTLVAKFQGKNDPEKLYQRVLSFSEKCMKLKSNNSLNLFFVVRLGIQYYQAKQYFRWDEMSIDKFTFYLNNVEEIEPDDLTYFEDDVDERHIKPFPAFNSEKGVSYQIHDELLSFLVGFGFDINNTETEKRLALRYRLRNNEIKLFFDPETLELLYVDVDPEIYGHLDIINDKEAQGDDDSNCFYDSFDVRLQICGSSINDRKNVDELREMLKSNPILKFNEDHNIEVLCSKKRIVFMREEMKTKFKLLEDCSENLPVYMLLESKRQYAITEDNICQKCMEVENAIDVKIDVDQQRLLADEPYEASICEFVTEIAEWLSLISKKVQLSPKRDNVKYFTPGAGFGFTNAQACVIEQILRNKEDFFRMFGIYDDNAPVKIISRRYRNLSQAIHPDKCSHPKSGEAMMLLNHAYKSMTDE